MFPTPPDQSVRLGPVAIGSLLILLALWHRPLLRWLELKPLSEVFTTPRFQHSAKITERLGRLFLMTFGIGFLIQGVGAIFLPADITSAVSWAVLALSGLIVLAMAGVVLAHRNPQ